MSYCERGLREEGAQKYCRRGFSEEEAHTRIIVRGDSERRGPKIL